MDDFTGRFDLRQKTSADRPVALTLTSELELFCHHSPAASYAEETHDTLQVCIPFRGARYEAVRSSAAGSRLVHRLGARDILVIPRQQPHAIEWQRSADIVSLQMSERFLSSAVGQDGLDFGDGLVLRDPFISAAAEQVRAEMLRGPDPSAVMLEALATVIAFRLSRRAAVATSIAVQGVGSPFTPDEFRRIDAFIADHIDQPITLGALSDLMGMSRWQFSRRFRATQGITPGDFVIQRRLREACSLLAGSDLPIISVALEVGLSHSHFSRSFHALHGVSPSEYRRQARVGG